MDAVQALTLSAVRENDVVIVRASGELDFATVRKLVETVEEAIDETDAGCVLDCREVTFIDSETFKSLLMLERKLARGGQFLRLGGCSSQVARAVVLLGLNEHLGFPPVPEPRPNI